jgi:hypothetical protein
MYNLPLYHPIFSIPLSKSKVLHFTVLIKDFCIPNGRIDSLPDLKI